MHRTSVLARIAAVLGALPASTGAGPTDTVARLSGASGDVRIGTALDAEWAPASFGMELWRTWGVSTEPRTSAEITFLGTQQLVLRERTIVAIDGPVQARARTVGPEVVLEVGGVRSRVTPGIGNGPPAITVITPSARAVLGRGSAVVAVGDDGVSTIANHEGSAIELRGPGKSRVSVGAGMGTRVERGKPPEPPRPLPASPSWIAGGHTRFVAIDGRATLRGAWSPITGAAGYRYEVARRGIVVAAGEVPAAESWFELKHVPPGEYQVQVASIAADRLESAPAQLAITVRAVAIAPPGGQLPAIAPPPADDPIAPPPPAAGSIPLVSVGARLVAADGMLCDGNRNEVWQPVTVLDTTGAAQIPCVEADGTRFAPFPIEIQAVDVTGTPSAASIVQGDTVDLHVALRSIAPLGDAWVLEPTPGLSVDSTTRTPEGLHARVHVADDAPAAAQVLIIDETTQRVAGRIQLAIAPLIVEQRDPPLVVPPAGPAAGGPAQFSVSAFVGWFQQPYDGEIGNSLNPDYVVDSAPAVGVRGAWWFRARYFVEVQALLSPGGYVGNDESALVIIAGGHAGASLLALDRMSLRGLAGVGAHLLRTDATRAADDFNLGLHYGLAATYDLGGSLHVRLDGRQHIVPDRIEGLTSAFELTAGVELALPRR